MNRYTLWLLIAFLVNTVHIHKGFGQGKPVFKMSYLEDVNGLHSFESVKQEQFQVAKNNIIALGFTESTIWAKIKLNTNLLQSNSVLEIDSPLLDEITLCYITNDSTRIVENLGVMYPQSNNQLNHYVPAFEIPTGRLKSPEIYIKLKSRWQMSVAPSIKSIEVFHKERVNTYLIAALFLGGMVFMIIYNLFLFFSLRDFSYLLYVLVLTFTILSQGYLFGVFLQYLSPEWPEFSFRIPVFVMAGACIFSIWFVLEFLNIKKSDGIVYWLLIIGLTIPIITILLEVLEFEYLSRKMTIAENIILAVVIYLSSIYSLVKGNKVALYFNIAWTIYLMGIIVYALKAVGVFPINFFTEYFVNFGSFIEVMVLSFALAYKYKLVRLEKEKLEQQTRTELEDLVNLQTIELENSLKEKEILLKEIHHRVKNNLQIVISLLDLQVASIKDIKNKKILQQSKSRVYSMSLIHQKLYQSDNLTRVNMKNYLEELFTFIQNSYSDTTQKIKSNLEIDNKELSLTQAVPLGLIVNELLTNSFKYGFDSKKEGQIQISFKSDDKNIVLMVADSGLGFDENEHKKEVKSSLGLFLIKSLTKQLRGETIRFLDKGFFITKLTIPVEDQIKL
jgi:two-component sensor histidine kinase